MTESAYVSSKLVILVETSASGHLNRFDKWKGFKYMSKIMINDNLLYSFGKNFEECLAEPAALNK